MARLEQTIENIVNMFVEHSGDDGKLKRMEMKNLLEKEIQKPEIKAKLKEGECRKAMKCCDEDGDKAFDFDEFCECVITMAKCCYAKKMGKC